MMISDLDKEKKTLSAKKHDDFWVPFQRRTDLVETIKEDERFYNGEQWPDNNVNNEARVTLNFVQDGIRKKAAKINGTPIHFSYVASDGKTDCTLLRRYDESVQAKLGFRAFSLQSAINGENLGTEITYIRWDNDAPWETGGFFEGGLELEHISPLNFACANPHQPSIQKQEWVMFWHDIYIRKLIEVLRDEGYDKETLKDKTQHLYDEGRMKRPDDQNPDKDILDDTLVRVYLRFFRIDGEVVYTMETDYVSLLKYPRPLSKVVAEDFAKAKQEALDKMLAEGKFEYDDDGVFEDDEGRKLSLVEDYDLDLEDTIANVHDKARDPNADRRYREKFTLYPFAKFTPMEQNNFFFGISLTKQMIRIQKAVNFQASMNVRYMETLVAGKLVAKEDAIKDPISSDPEDRVITDYSKNINGWGVKALEVQSMPSEMLNVPTFFINQMKSAYGFNDIISGDTMNGDVSGYAISLAMKQANSTLEQEQQLFWQYQTELCRIRIMFYKHYIDKRQFSYELSNAEYDIEEGARQTLIKGASKGIPVQYEGREIPPDEFIKRFGEPTSRYQVRTIRGEDLWGLDFDLKITAQQGMAESEYSTQQWYTQMFGNGGMQQYVDNPDLLSFIIETAPNGVLPEEYRSTAKHYVEKIKSSLVIQLRSQVAELQAQVEQLTILTKAREEQFKQRINTAGTMVKNAQSDMKAAQKEAERANKTTQSLLDMGYGEGQIKSNNAKGMTSAEQSSGSAVDPTAIQTPITGA